MITLTTVFICGSTDDSAFERLMRQKLSESYRVTYIKKGNAWQKGNGYEITAADFPYYQNISVEQPVLVMKKEAVCHIALPENATVIACAENSSQLRALKNCGGHILTCGYSPRDTFSYSSLAENTVTVSLNREITAFSGKKIQPLEIPLEIPAGADIYSLLAFTALRLLLDDFNSEIGELY